MTCICGHPNEEHAERKGQRTFCCHAKCRCLHARRPRAIVEEERRVFQP